VAEGGTGVDILWAALYAGALGWTLGLDVAVTPLAVWLFSERLIRYTGDIAFVYVAVQGGGGYCPLSLFAQGAGNLVGGAALFDLLRNVGGIVVPFVQLDRGTLDGGLPVGIVLGNLVGVFPDSQPSAAVQVVIKAMSAPVIK